MGRLNPRLRILDWMIGTAVSAAVLQSEIEPLIQPDRKYLLVFTLGVYPLAVFPPYCIFRARGLLRGGSLTRTDYLAAAVWLLSLMSRVHSHMSKFEVYTLRLSVIAMGALVFDVLRGLCRRYLPGGSKGSPPP